LILCFNERIWKAPDTVFLKFRLQAMTMAGRPERGRRLQLVAARMVAADCGQDKMSSAKFLMLSLADTR
jgi:hypothetical protein